MGVSVLCCVFVCVRLYVFGIDLLIMICRYVDGVAYGEEGMVGAELGCMCSLLEHYGKMCSVR